jgi:hypothetical protein
MRLSALSFCLFCLLPVTLKAQNTCHCPDVNSDHFIYSLNKMMAAEQTAFRAKLSMPLVTSAEIYLVSDSTTCALAGAAADSMVKVWLPNETVSVSSTSLYVIKIGTSYAVADLNSPRTSEFAHVLIFGPRWEYRGIIAM